jgi:pyrroloquinoline-quinone synthase
MSRTVTLQIEPKLLNHPWYRKWECGELPVDSLRHYASEYYWQVSNFPRYLSLLHSQMESLTDRRVILGNLADEENEKAPHPELWLDFAEALGLNRQQIATGKPGPAAAALVDEFRSIVASGPAAGLGALMAYESQVPEVARFKSEALVKFYLSDAEAEKGTRFFAVHEQADVWHTRELEDLIVNLSDEQKRTAQRAAHQACAALGKFLDAMPN